MKHIALFMTSVALAGNIAVNPGPIDDDGGWLQYHNGTPAWISWEGTYRGVWFNVWDFYPGSYFHFLEGSEFWFYHDASHPWDTSDVYLEVWNGDAMGPMTQLDQRMLTAVHYSPIIIHYEYFINIDQNFWAVTNTEMSAGGWPSTLGDGAQGDVFHSFNSDNFLVWEPWDKEGACNYFVSAEWSCCYTDFEGTTWGALKSSF